MQSGIQEDPSQEALVNKLITSNDWTAFYRNMNKVESESDDILNLFRGIDIDIRINEKVVQS